MKNSLRNYLNVKVIGRLRKHNILQRLVISFLALCFVPMLAAGLYSYNESTSEIRSKLGSYSEEIVSQVQKNVSNRFGKIRNDSIDIVLNDQVQTFMEKYETSSPSVQLRMQEDMLNLLMNKFSFSTDVEDVLLISKDKKIDYTYSNQRSKLYLNESCITKLMGETEKGPTCWYVMTKDEFYRKDDYAIFKEDPNKPEASILFCCRIKSAKGEKRGYLVVNMKQNLINDIFKGTSIGADTKIFMLDNHQMVVSTNHEDVGVAKVYPDEDLRKKLEMNIAAQPARGIFNLSHGLESDMVVYSKLQDIDWYIICRISGNYLNKESLNISFSILGIAILNVLVAIIFSIAISSSILNPLRKMIRVINVVKGGNLNAKINDIGTDELAIVANSFDSMTDEVSNLIQEIKDTEDKKRRLEFEALQAQINPHFISNTLNSIAWLAQIQKADNIVTIVNSLTRLLNESMHNGRDMISIRDEIDYIEKYITIQSYRFISKISLEIQIPEEIMEKSIPKFTIEPLVENSVVHGLAPDSKEIHIVIKAVEMDGNLEISVIDDGVGIPDAGEKGPVREEISGKGSRLHGIGLKNVDSRLKLYYGEKYGLSIFSVPNSFTMVSILLPGHPEVRNGQEPNGN